MRLLFLHNILTSNIIQAFCWMLVHSLWQGLAFTIITGLAMLVTKKSSARVRYNAVCTLFFVFMAVCAATFMAEFFSTHMPNALQNATIAAGSLSGVQAAFKRFGGYFSANAPIIVLGWFIIFSAKCAHMATSLAYSQRVKNHKAHQPPIYWLNKITALGKSLHIKKAVRLLESEIVKMPVVIGHFKPVVFIPLGLLNSMPAGEMEAVLLHELAHIRRNDYFVNFIQVVAENIFFFNPALLWMSSLLREERENCCDDVALAETKSKKQFIQALISFKEHALHVNSYTTAFPAKKNQLLLRVTRIIKSENKSLNAAEKIFFLASFVVLGLLTIAVSNGQAGQVPEKTVANISQAAANTGSKAKTLTATRFAVTDSQDNVAEVREPKQSNKIDNGIVAETDESNGVDAAENEALLTGNKMTALINVGNEEEKLTDAERAELDRQQAMRDKAQADADKIQADRDRAQADEDRKQADRDRRQADEDRKQDMRDKEQAQMAQAQALLDQQQASLDRLQAEKSRVEAQKNRAADQRKTQQH